MSWLKLSLFGSRKKPEKGLPSKSIPTGANLAVLGEAKELLFSELATLLRFGVAPGEALRLIGQNWTQHSGQRAHWSPGPMRLFPIVTFVLQFLMMALLTVHGLLWRNPRRVARLMAARLVADVEGGLMLSEAMANHRGHFTAEEVRLVAFGELSNSLPAAMASIAEYHRVDRQSMAAMNGLLYPAFLLLTLFSIGAHVVITIVPKLEDIFSHLGGELPFLFQQLADLGNRPELFGMATLTIWLIFTVVWIIWSSQFLNGSAWGGYLSLLLILLYPPVWGMGFAAVALIGFALGTSAGPVVGVVLFFSLFVMPIFARQFLLRWWERGVRLLDQGLMGLCRFMPFLGAGVRGEEEARWLTALSATVRAGLPLDQAMAMAASMGPPRFAPRTRELADGLQRGLSLGELMSRAAFPSPVMQHRLAWLETSGTLREGIGDVLSDKRTEVADRLTRALRAVEVMAVLVCGVVFGLLITAVYLPFFEIPRLLANSFTLN